MNISAFSGSLGRVDSMIFSTFPGKVTFGFSVIRFFLSNRLGARQKSYAALRLKANRSSAETSRMRFSRSACWRKASSSSLPRNVSAFMLSMCSNMRRLSSSRNSSRLRLAMVHALTLQSSLSILADRVEALGLHRYHQRDLNALLRRSLVLDSGRWRQFASKHRPAPVVFDTIQCSLYSLQPEAYWKLGSFGACHVQRRFGAQPLQDDNP